MNIDHKFSSPNYSVRQSDVSMVVLHFTEIGFDEAVERLCDPRTKLSAHYVIKSNGEIFNLVDEAQVAWHAGVSFWQDFERINEHSIGIEIDNDGKSDFPTIQMDACVALCSYLKNKYNICRKNFLGHSDIAPTRKIDPGILFDWSYLAKSDLGLWYDENININAIAPEILLQFGLAGPQVLKLQTALNKLGYKIEITGLFDTQTNFVVRAFQAHFYPEIMQKLGMDHYWSDDSKYFWDSKCESILQSFIKS